MKTIFIVVVPWDYTTADCVVFSTRKEAEDCVAYDVDEKARHYATVKEQEVP